MYKYILQSVENLNWLAIIPMLIFMTIFLLSSYRILRRQRSFVDKMAALPLEELQSTEKKA
ncbi:MAG: cbb3-type cytochrome c oxidase subunit 3 [Bacteroidota bacterium]